MNAGLSKKLALAESNEKLLQKELGIRDSDHKKMEKWELKWYSKRYKTETVFWRNTESLGQLNIDGKKETEKDRTISISVKVGFKLNKRFEKWDDRCVEEKWNGESHEYYLFCDDLDRAGSRSFLLPWHVHYFGK